MSEPSTTPTSPTMTPLEREPAQDLTPEQLQAYNEQLLKRRRRLGVDRPVHQVQPVGKPLGEVLERLALLAPPPSEQALSTLATSSSASTSTAVAAPVRRAEMVTAAQAAEMMLATAEACEEAIVVVHGALGIGPPVVDGNVRATEELAEQFYQRIAEQAQILASGGWTASMVKATTIGLAQSPELDDKIRFGRPIGAVDFERVRRKGLAERTVRDDDGYGTFTERVITTRSGFALKVAAAKLYTAPEMLALWRAAGEIGRNCDGIRQDGTVAVYEDAMFTPVEVEGVGRRFRLKG